MNCWLSWFANYDEHQEIDICKKNIRIDVVKHMMLKQKLQSHKHTHLNTLSSSLKGCAEGYVESDMHVC